MGMTSNQTGPKGGGDNGPKIKDMAAARTVGMELEELGKNLGQASKFMEGRPLKDQGFGNMPSDSPSAGQALSSAVSTLVTSLGYAQQVIAGTSEAIASAMDVYEAQEEAGQSDFKATEAQV